LELRAVAVPLACVLVAFGLSAAFTAPGFIPRYYVLHQDGFVAAGLAALLLLFCVPRLSIPVPSLPKIELTTRSVLIGAAIGAVLLWAATYVLFGDYPLSRDEQMVVFDMQVFRHGELAAPIAPEWRRYADALTPAFLLPLPGNAAWVSSYMPVNAMLRALFGLLDPALTAPALAALGAVATFDCARRLFPTQRGAQAIALLIYATSAQVLVTAMTPYAMTAHLALNMIWLALYLRGSRSAHAGAMAIGFLAIGLPLVRASVHRASATARRVADRAHLSRQLCGVRDVLDFLAACRRGVRGTDCTRQRREFLRQSAPAPHHPRAADDPVNDRQPATVRDLAEPRAPAPDHVRMACGAAR
jgi:hypothetical protein